VLGKMGCDEAAVQIVSPTWLIDHGETHRFAFEEFGGRLRASAARRASAHTNRDYRCELHAPRHFLPSHCSRPCAATISLTRWTVATGLSYPAHQFLNLICWGIDVEPQKYWGGPIGVHLRTWTS